MESLKFFKEDQLKEDKVGIATGLAWTQVGGEILYVECIKLSGKGGFTLTGQLGKVMEESAKAAFSYVRSYSERLGIPPSWFRSNEVHIHLPAGAVPKDGPSAGVTLATSLNFTNYRHSCAKGYCHDRGNWPSRAGFAGRRH